MEKFAQCTLRKISSKISRRRTQEKKKTAEGNTIDKGGQDGKGEHGDTGEAEKEGGEDKENEDMDGDSSDEDELELDRDRETMDVDARLLLASGSQFV